MNDAGVPPAYVCALMRRLERAGAVWVKERGRPSRLALTPAVPARLAAEAREYFAELYAEHEREMSVVREILATEKEQEK